MLFFREVDKANAEADTVLMKSDLAAQWKPRARRELDLKVDWLAFCGGDCGVKEAAADADVADARRVLA